MRFEIKPQSKQPQCTAVLIICSAMWIKVVSLRSVQSIYPATELEDVKTGEPRKR